MDKFVYIIILPIFISITMSNSELEEPLPGIFRLITFIIRATADFHLCEFSVLSLK